MAQKIVVYNLASAAVVSRHAEGECSVCSARMSLHPVLHLGLDYSAGSPVSPGQVYSHSFLDAYCAMRLVKPSLGTNTAVAFWLECTRFARESGVPMPPPPRNATLAVALLELQLQKRLQSVESGASATCPQCLEVQGPGAFDGNFKCDCFEGAHAGSPSYASAMSSTASALRWVPRGDVIAAEALHGAQATPDGDRSCGGVSNAGVHISTRSTKSSNGVVMTSCDHLYVLALSDLALGEKFSQLALHVQLWKRTVAGQRAARHLATSLVAHVVPLQAAIAAGGHVGCGVFVSAVAFLGDIDIAAAAPLLVASLDAPIVWGAGVGGGAAGGAGGAAAGAGPAAPIPAGALARAPAPGGQGATGWYRGAAELLPPDTVAPFEPSLPKFLQLHSCIRPCMSPLSPLFADSLCRRLGNYLVREGLLDGDVFEDGVRVSLNAFHAHGHAAPCLPLHSGAFCRGMGSCDGECSERCNARYGLLARSTRTMGPARRGALLALDAVEYSAARAECHAEYLEAQCIIALRRLYHADEDYARVLVREAASTRLRPVALHARAPTFIAELLQRYRALDDASAGVAPTTVSRMEQLQGQLGMARVRVLSLEFFLASLMQRDAHFIAAPAMAAALADFDKFHRTKDMQGSLIVLKARLAGLRAVVADLQRRVTAKGGAAGDDVAAVAYNTGCYRKALVAVMDLLQRLKEGHAVRDGLAYLPHSPTRTHVTRYLPLHPHRHPRSASPARRTRQSGPRSRTATPRRASSS